LVSKLIAFWGALETIKKILHNTPNNDALYLFKVLPFHIYNDDVEKVLQHFITWMDIKKTRDTLPSENPFNLNLNFVLLE
jgi:hypothetical protein